MKVGKKIQHLIALAFTWFQLGQFGHNFNLYNGVYRSQFDMSNADTETFRAEQTNAMAIT